MPHLDVLRARLASYRKRAVIIPGLPELIDTLEAHMVETETRLLRLEQRFPEHSPTLPPPRELEGAADSYGGST